jgi:hypothetical protein
VVVVSEWLWVGGSGEWVGSLVVAMVGGGWMGRCGWAVADMVGGGWMGGWVDGWVWVVAVADMVDANTFHRTRV